jgi:hypothetical protein
MSVRDSRPTPGLRRAAFPLLAAVVGASLLASCGGGASPRPSDPRQILTNAIRATALVPTLKLHAEVNSSVGAGLGLNGGQMTMALDADVDVAARQFAGRATTRMPAALTNGALPAVQVQDVIVTQAATFNRDSQTGRWMKMGSAGIDGGPTNAEIATMVTNLLSNPSVALDLAEAGPCSLGTCDHVIAHIDGAGIGAAIGPLLGMPVDAAMGQAIPNFDIDVLIDQSTSVISELRTQLSLGGTGTALFLSISNPGAAVQIAPPPPALVDDMGLGGLGVGGGGVVFFGGGGQVTTILETVGSEIGPTPILAPSDPESPSP